MAQYRSLYSRQYLNYFSVETRPLNPPQYTMSTTILGVFPQKKAKRGLIGLSCGELQSRFCFHRTHTQKSIARIFVPSKIRLQPCLEILERITTSYRDGYNNPIIVCFYRRNSGKASLAWIYRLASDKRISIYFRQDIIRLNRFFLLKHVQW